MSDPEAGELATRIESWLSAQMPMIQMHGGTSAVREVDPEEGHVVLELGGTCAGCGISQRTESRLREELTAHFDAVTSISVQYLADGSGGWAGDQPETFMGMDRNEGGRGGQGKSRPMSDHL
ncbi:MAG: NifU family protein [Halodesulfurarchaeum sp.]